MVTNFLVMHRKVLVGKFIFQTSDPPVLANHQLLITRFFDRSFSDQSPQKLSAGNIRSYRRQVSQKHFGCMFYNRLIGGGSRQAVSHTNSRSARRSQVTGMSVHRVNDG